MHHPRTGALEGMLDLLSKWEVLELEESSASIERLELYDILYELDKAECIDRRDWMEGKGGTETMKKLPQKKRGRKKKELVPTTWSRKITNFFSKP